MTIGEAISRLRILIKSVKQDATLSDRFIFSMIMKHGKLLMRRQDNLNRIMKFNSIFQTLDFVELIEIDKIQAQCKGIKSGCSFKRTKVKLPTLIEGYWGVLIRSVTSLDYSEQLQYTYPTTYEQMTSQKYFKYNKKKYFWYLDGHLYFPNLDWDAVRLEGIFEGDISNYNCDTSDDCRFMQDRKIPIPEFLFSEIENMALKELTVMLQVPVDTKHDAQNVGDA
mgnify:CR=1 FL=1|tara:strand:- start:895 stop:1566 length:672 start_codon:yes stop_codon:yes gene_type:complete